jgi:formamidopyrimidine-DNA glycosylase
MPELPEVQTVVVTLRPRLLGRPILAVTLARTDILCPPDADLPALLTGRTVTSLERRGKKIIFTLDDGNRFVIHLGMTGQLTVTARADPLPPHTHLCLDLRPDDVSDDAVPRKLHATTTRTTTTTRTNAPPRPPHLAAGPQDRHPSPSPSVPLQLRFRDPRRFGGIWWLGSSLPPDAGMGPEPLSLRPAQLARRLARTTRAVKNALMDQSVVAGLGNIYVDESLFAAGIHPLAPADTLSPDQVARLNRAIKTTLRRAIRNRGSTLRDYRDADGAAGSFQRLHRVYERAGEPCRRCRAKIARIVLGGRSTHFCPNCQPPPKANARGAAQYNDCQVLT